MKSFKLSLDTTNAAFTDGPHMETARILRELADKIDGTKPLNGNILRDVNGNAVGAWEAE